MASFLRLGGLVLGMSVVTIGCLSVMEPVEGVNATLLANPYPEESAGTAAPTSDPNPEEIAGIASPLPAFPGAEGWGAESIGGRGGRVIEVTNLDDSGPGSLRAAIDAHDPRILVFRVAGVIRLESRIRLTQPFITIAGQTAPGGGITIVGGYIQIETHNVIVRYLRWRGLGPEQGTPTFIRLASHGNLHDVILDHLSASWNWDDFGGWFNDPPNPDMINITVQNLLLAEALDIHHTAMLFGGRAGDKILPHRIHHISVHHNLFVHNGHRNPQIKSRNTEVINNVVFNWKHRMGTSGFGDQTDWINNYWLSGPMSAPDHILLHEPAGEDPLSSIYIAGNFVPSLRLYDPTIDNWFLVRENIDGKVGPNTSSAHRRLTPLEPAPIPVSIQPAADILTVVVMDAGANRRLNGDGTFSHNRDAVDQRLASDVLNGTGPSRPPEDAGSIPSIDPGQPYPDTDHDGMADEWENLHCFDPNDPTDSPEDADVDGYTNVEEFLNGTHPTGGRVCASQISPLIVKSDGLRVHQWVSLIILAGLGLLGRLHIQGQTG